MSSSMERAMRQLFVCTEYCLFIVLYMTLCRASAKDLEILASLPYNIGVAPDVVLTGAAFDLAAQSVTRKMQLQANDSTMTTTVKYLYNATHRTCDDVTSQAAQMLAEYAYRHRKPDTCYAVITTPCTDQAGIASLARSFDWPLFTNVLSKNDFINPQLGSPTAIAAGGTFFGYARVVVEILNYHLWFRATIFVESKAIATFYKDLGSQLLEMVRQAPQPFSIELTALNSATNDTMKPALIYAKQRSRVLILLTSGTTAARILDMTDTLGMANGEYVFINVQALQSDTYGKISQFQHPLDDSTLNAFRSMIFIAYRSVASQLTELNTAISERSRVVYNYTYTRGNQPLDSYAVQSSYDIVELFANVVQENTAHSRNDSAEDICSGLKLARLMSNRTYSLSTGELFLSSKRVRNLDVDIFGFNTSTAAMQSIGAYKWSTSQLVWSKSRTIDWPTSNGQPPLSEPSCGFSGNEGPCSQNTTYSVVTPVIGVVIGGSMLLLVVLLTARLHGGRRQNSTNPDSWWQIDCGDLPAKTKHPSYYDRLSSATVMQSTIKPLIY